MCIKALGDCKPVIMLVRHSVVGRLHACWSESVPAGRRGPPMVPHALQIAWVNSNPRSPMPDAAAGQLAQVLRGHQLQTSLQAFPELGRFGKHRQKPTAGRQWAALIGLLEKSASRQPVRLITQLHNSVSPHVNQIYGSAGYIPITLDFANAALLALFGIVALSL